MARKSSTNPFENIEGFEWDKANVNKNLVKHKVSWQEAEEVFNNQPLIIAEDIKHSKVEQRYSALGKTNKGRKLTLIFTVRRRKLRIVSARDQSRAERRKYEQFKTN